MVLEAPPDGFLYLPEYKKYVSKKVLTASGHRRLLWKEKEGVAMPHRSIPVPEPPGMYRLRRSETQGVTSDTLIAVEHDQHDHASGGDGGDDDADTGGASSSGPAAAIYASARGDITGKDYIKRLALSVGSSVGAVVVPVAVGAESDDEALVAGREM